MKFTRGKQNNPRLPKHWNRVNPTPMEVGLGVMQSFLFCCWAKRRESKRIDFRYWFFNCPLKFFLLDQMVFLMHFQSNQTRCWVALVWDLKLIVWRQNLFWSELLFQGEKKKKDNTFTIFWLQTVAFWFNLFYCLWCLRISEKIIKEKTKTNW